MTVYLRNVRTVTAADADALRESFPRRVQRAERYRLEDDRLRSLAAALLLRDALGAAEETALRYGPKGKPYWEAGPAFSLSHSGDWAALAVGEPGMRAVGVDIERPRAARPSLMRRVCCPEELAWLADGTEAAEVPPRIDFTVACRGGSPEPPALTAAGGQGKRAAEGGGPYSVSEPRFFWIWTWKEAVLKAIGTGLGTELRELCVLPFTEGRPVEIDGKSWYGAAAEYAGYRVALCADAPIERCELKIAP